MSNTATAAAVDYTRVHGGAFLLFYEGYVEFVAFQKKMARESGEHILRRNQSKIKPKDKQKDKKG